MLTVRMSQYDKRSTRVLLDAIKGAQFSLQCNENLDCTNCPNKVPCQDLSSTAKFLYQKLHENEDVENPVENVEK